jgi:hypothetical protein
MGLFGKDVLIQNKKSRAGEETRLKAQGHLHGYLQTILHRGFQPDNRRTLRITQFIRDGTPAVSGESQNISDLFAGAQQHFTVCIQGFLQLKTINGKSGSRFRPGQERTEENEWKAQSARTHHGQSSTCRCAHAQAAFSGLMVLSVGRQGLNREAFAQGWQKNKADKLRLPAPERWDCQNRHSKIPPDSLPFASKTKRRRATFGMDVK